MTIPPLWSPALPPDPEQVEVTDEPAAGEYGRAVPAQNYAAPAASNYSSAPPLPTRVPVPTPLSVAEVTTTAPVQYATESIFLPLHGIWAHKVVFGGNLVHASWIYQTGTGWREVPPDVQRSINAATK